MPKEVTASCLCGDCQIVCGAPVGAGSYCHCTDCRKQTGSAFSVALPFDISEFHILSGAFGSYTKIGDSGDKITRNFCLACGSPVFGTSQSYPELVFVKAGSLDDQSFVQPTHQSWCHSKTHWSEIDEKLPSFTKAKGA